MARTRIQTFRSSIKNERPAAVDSPLAGEFYVNTADKQIGIVDTGATTNTDLLPVRFFTTTTDYKIGDYVTNAGQLYRCKTAVTSGSAFDATKWDAVGGGGGATVTISDTPPASPTDNQLWWESDTGGFFIRFNDGTSTQWVQVNGAGGGGGGISDAPNDTGLYARYQNSWYDINTVFYTKSQADAKYATAAALGSYLPLAGGTITGSLAVNGSITVATGLFLTWGGSSYIGLNSGANGHHISHPTSGFGSINVSPSTVRNTFAFGGNVQYSFDTSYFFPNTNGGPTLGTGSFRWGQIYSTTATISTSDERIKQDIRGLDEAEKRVAAALRGLIVIYRLKASVEEKGDEARLHSGVIAQGVAEAFAAEGLDVARYGLWCADEQYMEEQIDDPETGIRYEQTPTGEVVYSIRYEELLAFIIGGL